MRCRLALNYAIAMAEHKRENEPEPEPEPEPSRCRAAGEARHYKKNWRSRARSTGARRRGPSRGSTTRSRAVRSPSRTIRPTASSSGKRWKPRSAAHSRDCAASGGARWTSAIGAEYEAVYGRGTWAKVPVCEQQGAADEARAAKESSASRRARPTRSVPRSSTKTCRKRSRRLSEDEAEGEAFEKVEDTTEDALNDLDARHGQRRRPVRRLSVRVCVSLK